MSHLDPLILARIQFAFTVSFHIIFPAITIGLGCYLAVLEGLWLLKKDPVYLDLHHFWAKIFAVNFAMGVVSGLVMAYEFGTNWSGFSAFAGGVTGPLLAYEVLTAFFLEAGFLGVMLFGWNKVGPGLHFFSTLMVTAGTLMSMTWILASNSWMQTPQGYEIINGRVVPTDWLQVIFNPSFPYRLVHMGLACILATALIVGAAGAWHLLHHRDNPRVREPCSPWRCGCCWSSRQSRSRPAISMASTRWSTSPPRSPRWKGHWSNTPGEAVPLILFGWPDMAEQKTLAAVQIPHLGSLILTHSLERPDPRAGQFPPSDRPDSTVIFWTFRLMAGLGMLMLLLGVLGAWFRWRGAVVTRIAGSCGSPRRWGRPAHRACSPAGSPPRWAVSPGWSTA